MGEVMSNENTAKIDPEYQQAIDALKEYMAESGKNQAQIVKELGKSSGLISAFLSGKYTTPHAIIPSVMSYIEVNRKKKAAPTAPGYAETSLSRLMEASIAYAHVQGLQTVIYGDAGVGKTTAANAYTEREKLATYIYARPDCASYTGVMSLVADAFGIRDRITRNITNEFIKRMKGSGRVLIVDEAQHLTVRALNHLRCISDESGVGIALVGNEEVYSKLRGSGKADFAQLFSRVGMRKQVQTRDIKMEDIRSIFGRYELDEGVMKLLGGVANTPYGLRGAVNVYVNTAAVYGEITEKGMVKVMRDMNIG